MYFCADIQKRNGSHKASLTKRIKQSSPWIQVRVAPKYRVTCHINISYFPQNSRFLTCYKKALHDSHRQEENGLIHKLVSLFAQSVTSLRRVWPLRDFPISTGFFRGKSFDFEIFFGKCNTSSRVKTLWLSKMYQLV